MEVAYIIARVASDMTRVRLLDEKYSEETVKYMVCLGVGEAVGAGGSAWRSLAGVGVESGTVIGTLPRAVMYRSV